MRPTVCFLSFFFAAILTIELPGREAAANPPRSVNPSGSSSLTSNPLSAPTGSCQPFLPPVLCDGCGWVLKDCCTGAVVVPRLELAVSFRARRIGLQHRGGMSRDAGLLLVPANRIHTRNMCFAIDLVYLDRCGTVIAIRRNVCPGRFLVPRVLGAHAVLETRACAANVHIGQRLCVEPASG